MWLTTRSVDDTSPSAALTATEDATRAVARRGERARVREVSVRIDALRSGFLAQARLAGDDTGNFISRILQYSVERLNRCRSTGYHSRRGPDSGVIIVLQQCRSFTLTL